MTHREFRELLNTIDNKRMSVWDLRRMIFLLDDPDSEITADSIQRAEQAIKSRVKDNERQGHSEGL